MPKPVFCPNCRTANSFIEYPKEDIKGEESGKILWLAYK